MKKNEPEKNEKKIDLTILKSLAEATKISEEDILVSLEEAINQAYDKKNGVDEFEMTPERKAELQSRRFVEIDRETGDIHVFFAKDVVEEVTDSETQVSLDEALLDDENFQIGDKYEIDITPNDFQDLGRVMAHHTKAMFTQKVTERERAMVMDEYKDKEGEIILAKVETTEEIQFIDPRDGKAKIKKRIILSTDSKIECVLESEDQLPGDTFKAGDSVKAYLVKVADRKERTKRKGVDKRQADIMREPVLKLSRSNNGFLRKLLELEVPEIRHGIVEIKGIARKPGQRAKVAVVSYNEDVDPITACVGEKGNRINSITEELGGEKIDVVRWSPDIVEYVENALAPAKCRNSEDVSVYEEEVQNKDGRLKNRQVVSIKVPDDQLTLAIGNKGLNVTLAAKLCNCRIDIKGNSGEDNESNYAKQQLEGFFA